MSYTVPEKRSVQKVGCVIEDGAVNHEKTETMFDYKAVPLRDRCLAEKVTLAPSDTHARLRHRYGYREPDEMEMASRYEKFCTIERMRQEVLENSR